MADLFVALLMTETLVLLLVLWKRQGEDRRRNIRVHRALANALANRNARKGVGL